MPHKPSSKRRQPWAQKLERGLYLRHSLSCPRTEDRNEKRSCACTSYQCSVPNGHQGSDQVTIHEATRADARARYAQMRSTALSRPKPVRPRKYGAGVTLKDCFVEYRDHQVKTGQWGSSQTVVSRWSHFRLRIDPILGHFDVRDISPNDCQKWWASLGTKNVASTRRTVKSLLNGVFEYAIDQDYRKDNPLALARIKPPKDELTRDASSKRVLGAEEIVEIANHSTNDAGLTLIITLGFTGLRKGEACALTWDRVRLDDEKPFLIIDRSARWETISRERQLRAIEGQQKVLRARRDVPINSLVAEVLRRIQPTSEQLDAVGAENYHLWPGQHKDETGKRQRTPAVMLSRKSPNQILARAVTKTNAARIEADKARLEPTSPHGLRHSFVSMSHRAGVEEARIAYLIGDDIATMKRVYMHTLSGEDLSSAVEAIVPPTINLRQ